MKTINFNNQPTKVITVEEFELLMNSVNLKFYGFDNISVNDRDTFEERTDISFSPMQDGNVKLHDLNYEWE